MNYSRFDKVIDSDDDEDDGAPPSASAVPPPAKKKPPPPQVLPAGVPPEKLQHFARQHGTTVFPVANGWTPGSEVCRSCRMEDNGARECHTLLLRSCF